MTAVKLLESPVYQDERGRFQEVFNRGFLEGQLGACPSFHQDNLSRSAPWVLRGLHYQHPQAQGKLVTCIRGAIFDVVVDLRAGSSSFGQWQGFRLDDKAGQQLWIPKGFAHGFLALGEGADVLYKVTAPYEPSQEGSIRWDDPTLAIPWPLPPGQSPLLSKKDAQGLSLQEASVFKG